MKRLLLAAFLMACLSESGLIQCQTSTSKTTSFEAFDNLFKEARTDTLHIFTYYEPVTDPSLMPRTGDTTYAGRKIADSLLRFLNMAVKPSPIDKVADLFYGLVKFKINEGYGAYLVRFWSDNYTDSEIYMYVYDKSNNTFSEHSILLSEFYAAEGGEGESNSWIFDIDNDGFPDVLTRTYKNRVVPDDADWVTIEEEDKLYLKIWSENEFVNDTLIDSEALKQKFKLRFTSVDLVR